MIFITTCIILSMLLGLVLPFNRFFLPGARAVMGVAGMIVFMAMGGIIFPFPVSMSSLPCETLPAQFRWTMAFNSLQIAWWSCIGSSWRLGWMANFSHFSHTPQDEFFHGGFINFHGGSTITDRALRCVYHQQFVTIGG